MIAVIRSTADQDEGVFYSSSLRSTMFIFLPFYFRFHLKQKLEFRFQFAAFSSSSSSSSAEPFIPDVWRWSSHFTFNLDDPGSAVVCIWSRSLCRLSSWRLRPPWSRRGSSFLPVWQKQDLQHQLNVGGVIHRNRWASWEGSEWRWCGFGEAPPPTWTFLQTCLWWGWCGGDGSGSVHYLFWGQEGWGVGGRLSGASS